jgi:chromosomal replication initiator protein
MRLGPPSLAIDGLSHANAAGLWQSCVDQLAQELPQQQFNTWIKPLVAHVSDDASKVVIFVGNRFKLDWIRAQYASRIAILLQQLHGQPIQVELAITPKKRLLNQRLFLFLTNSNLSLRASLELKKASQAGQGRG